VGVAEINEALFCFVSDVRDLVVMDEPLLVPDASFSESELYNAVFGAVVPIILFLNVYQAT
jgi:hypothetical protein